MQIKVDAATTPPAPAFDLAKLQAAFAHQIDPVSNLPAGVFESGQHPTIVGQAAYNSAYGTNFVTSSWCNVVGPTVNRCDGFARIFDQGGTLFGFNTLSSPTTKLQIPVEPKALHDEMNAVAFDEFGRMTANIGLEAVPATPGAQNIILNPFVNPITELIDATNLPSTTNAFPIATQDGTQIWKITHNGVDTHPIHFHLYDVQVLNRVTWDNIIIPPAENELGWKDTVRISPLQDTIVAIRPIMPTMPFDLPNSIRMQNPMTEAGSTMGFSNIDIHGNPTTPVTNQLVNFGAEYMWHCHILSHEEMDMMRPVSVAIPPRAADGLTSSVTGAGNNRRLVLDWNDNSINETAFLVQKTADNLIWTDVGTSLSPLDQPNTKTDPAAAPPVPKRTLTDPAAYNANAVVKYQVVAQNTIGYGGQFPSMTVKSVSAPLTVGTPPAAAPTAPTGLVATLQAGPRISLAFTDTATNEASFAIERSINGGAYVMIGTAPARANTGGVTYIDTTVAAAATNTTYTYRVAAANLTGMSAYALSAPVLLPAMPAAPRNFTATNGPNGAANNRSVILKWQDFSNNETGFTIQRATNAAFTAGLNTTTVAPGVGTGLLSITQTGLARNTNYYYRIRSNNGTIISSAWVNAVPLPVRTNP